MTEGQTESTTQRRGLVKTLRVVKDPALITIKTIKPNHVNELFTINTAQEVSDILEGQDIEILGIYQIYTIIIVNDKPYKIDSGEFFWRIYRWKKYRRDEVSQWSNTTTKEKFAKYKLTMPQLFTA